jgi:hypothetical protein
MQLFEGFIFLGVRVVAVGQGIDSSSEQADVLIAVHGLIDSQYVKELAKKTHRGLEGNVLRGFHAGGRCFGYRNVKTADGVRLEVNEAEATTVRRIFEMSANGYSLKAITKALNTEQLPPPRARVGRPRATWCPTAIREMLRRELYVGRVVWNRSKFVKKPGSRKRLRRERPQSEWRMVDRPELRILGDEIWRAVQDRLAWTGVAYGRRGKGRNLIGRGVHHLLSGFLKCAECGSNLTIVVGAGKGRQARYGCPHNSIRGACSNNLREREDWIEERLLSDLQTNVLRPEVVDFAVEEFGRQLKARFSVVSAQLAVDRERKALLEVEIDRLWDLAAQGCEFESLRSQIEKRDREIREITDRLLSVGSGTLEAELEEIRRFVNKNLGDIRSLLNRDIPAARAELAKHVQEVRMRPKQVGAKRFYVADGEWNLLGGFKSSFLREPQPILREFDGCGGWI